MPLGSASGRVRQAWRCLLRNGPLEPPSS